MLKESKDKKDKFDYIDDIVKDIGGCDLNQDVDYWLNTGLFNLNYALSGKYKEGGIPVGRITEIYGSESSGKTNLATNIMIETQKRDGLAVFLDHEHAFSLRRGKSLGLMDKKGYWIYKQPSTGEESFDIIEKVVDSVRKYDSNRFVTVVIDSVASILTQDELDAGFDGQNMKTRLSLPALMSSSLKRLAKVVNEAKITLLFLNQTRDNVGVMFGSKEKTVGGNALKFYASVRIKLSKIEKIIYDKQIVGEIIRAQVSKNKVFEPFLEADYRFYFGSGIDYIGTHLDYLLKIGKIEKSGSWITFGDVKVQGYDNLVNEVRNNKKLQKKMLNLFD